MLQVSLSLRPAQSAIPTTDATIEHTGSIEDFPMIAKEGNIMKTMRMMMIRGTPMTTMITTMFLTCFTPMTIHRSLLVIMMKMMMN
jgi:hypothetical protein